MPCRVDLCPNCEDYNCPAFPSGEGCKNPRKGTKVSQASTSVPAPVRPSRFDTAGALCDLLTLLEGHHKDVFSKVDNATKAWWKKHEASEQAKIRKEALAKLSPREKRALNLKGSK